MQKAKLNFPLFFLVGPADNPTPLTNTPSDGANIVLRSGSITDGMLWKIEKLSSGNFKIKSKLQIPSSAQELVMAVSWSCTDQSADGLQIKALLYSNDNYNTDEWVLEQMYRPITVIHYYDDRMAGRFENLSEDIAEFQELISAYMLETFNIPLLYEIVQYTSISDVEPLRTFNSNEIKDDVVSRFGGGNLVTIPVIWTSATLTAYGGHYDPNPTRESIFIPIDISKSGEFNDQSKFGAIDCLCHELSHKLGLLDHYCYCSVYHDGLASLTADPNHECDCNNSNCSLHVFNEEFPNCMMNTRQDYDVKEMLENPDPEDPLYCEDCVEYLSKISVLGVWQ